MNKILVTDSLFIGPKYVKRIEDAGFAVERLDKPHASEEELIEAVKGKVGYILGGVENITAPVIEAANELKVIGFTGSGWSGHIPVGVEAAEKGILITNTPGSTTEAVSEFAVGLILMMLRRMLDLGRTGELAFATTPGLSDVQIGLVGMGSIAQKVVHILHGFGVKDIYYWNRTRRKDLEAASGLHYMELPELMGKSDLISSHVSDEAGTLINQKLISITKPDVIFINTGAHISFDMDALFTALSAGKARAAFDMPVTDERFKDLPLNTWFVMNANTGFNTTTTIDLTSDMVTESVINVLRTGTDQYVVNK